MDDILKSLQNYLRYANQYLCLYKSPFFPKEFKLEMNRYARDALILFVFTVSIAPAPQAFGDWMYVCP